ncbi:MAG: hypothetical protein AUK44_00490 [Porphyromonadaceae bacterium CG2_30_38_12]|nr:MAG: hypothetical protein AUK44_00490 [Porphyromonadaceae bacterium CG2_30_38_12]
MNRLFCIITFIYFIVCEPTFSQQNQTASFKIMSYNVENYFDVVDDSLTNDSEYLPGGMRGWNYEKYIFKQAQISKVIAALGAWEGPALIGLCEVESEKCLKYLTNYAGLKSFKYKYAHFESPDARGIDVALLYQPLAFKLIHKEAVSIHFPDNPTIKTRDLLYVMGKVPTGDTLHVFMCHFPSRLGGALESAHKRNYVASVLHTKTDSILGRNNKANIVIMGDFNDYPTDASLQKALGAKRLEKPYASNQLYNFMYSIHESNKGSHKHDGSWGALDQIIVSGNLLTSKTFYCHEAKVFDAEFLLENDLKFLGKQPFRTYNGMKYQKGFSDHLPVYVDFFMKDL